MAILTTIADNHLWLGFDYNHLGERPRGLRHQKEGIQILEELIARTRDAVKQILRRRSDRLLVVIGPCSIHDDRAAVEYAGRLARVRERLGDDLELVMRVYFEKPRTTVGWKGLINDPYLDGTFRINEGLRIARDLLLRINRLGVPAGSEFLDTISPQLSPREKAILSCLIEGDSNKCIARKIDIAEATVKVHVKAILRKIRVHNRTQAAIWGMNNGWLAQKTALPGV